MISPSLFSHSHLQVPTAPAAVTQLPHTPLQAQQEVTGAFPWGVSFGSGPGIPASL